MVAYSDKLGTVVCVHFFCMYSMCVTHLGLGALGLLFLNVHGQHLAAEREALGLLNHLLVRRYGVVPHDHMTLEIWTKWTTDSQKQPMIQSLLVLQTHHPTNTKQRLPRSYSNLL